MKTCVLLNNTTLHELNYDVMSELNRVVASHADDCFVLTENVSSKVIQNDFAIINISEICNFSDGVAVATSLDTANILLKNVIPRTQKVYWVWDLEWMYKPLDYEKVYSIINSPELALVARSKDHLHMIQNLFDRTADFIMRDFNLEELWNSLCNIKTN